MKDKRNIDELFKSHLRDYKATPSPEVWERIEAQLKKKKDRKVIPLWWKVGGVAALLALLLTVGNSLYVSDTSQQIVTEDNVMIDPTEEDKTNENTIIQEQDAIANEESSAQDVLDSTEDGVIEPKSTEAEINKSEDGIVNSESINPSKDKRQILQNPSTAEKKARIAESNISKPNDDLDKQRNRIEKPDNLPISEETGIAAKNAGSLCPNTR